MTNEHSTDLYQYIGKIELNAHQSKNSYTRYKVFCNALENLDNEKFSEKESKLAKDILRTRMEETKPCNIGCASGCGDSLDAD